MQDDMAIGSTAPRTRGRLGWWTPLLVFLAACSPRTERGDATPRPSPRGEAAAESAAAIHYRAIVIGISEYDSLRGNGWERLKTAQADAEAMADLLSRRYGFSVELLTGPRATKTGILTALDGLAGCGDRDAVLIYYAGHGYYDQQMDEGFWIPQDARRTADGRDAREDWIWNSMITKMIAASHARHVLVIADSCYGGSLFRGEDDVVRKRELAWYAEALNRPSRYLVASGDLEPVLDSGIEHSVFAEAVLQFLGTPDRPVFSASDLAMAVRKKVGALTGQMVRMGPLALASHAGGEFVFAADALELASLEKNFAGTGTYQHRSADPAAASPSAVEADAVAARDALWMRQEGVTNSAALLLDRAAAGGSPLAAAVSAYLDRSRQQQTQDQLRDLLKLVRDNSPGDRAITTPRVLPRILACLGPDAALPDGESQAMARLLRITLTAALQEQSSIVTVEREHLDALLQELQMGASGLADPNAQVYIGRLLPAGMLLTGSLFPQGDRSAALFRLVDTETSRIIKTWELEVDLSKDLAGACRQLAGQITDRLIEWRPIEAPVGRRPDGGYQIPAGSFHGLTSDAQLIILQNSSKAPPTEIGEARITRLGQLSSEIDIAFSSETDQSREPDTLWARERGP